MGSATVLKTEVIQGNSSLVEAISRSNTEIERRGRLLLIKLHGVTNTEHLMRYAALAQEIGYTKMQETGRRILNEGGTFPIMVISSLVEYEDGYAITAVEHRTGIEFTLPCRKPLKQYVGKPIDISRPNALQDYMGKPVTIDVLKNGNGYEAAMIGLSKDALGDANQTTRLDLIR